MAQDAGGPLRVIATHADGMCTVKLVGDLDTATAPELRDRLTTLITDGATDITLDLERLEFIDSTGLGVMVGALKKMREVGGALKLRAPHRSLLKVFEVAGLDTIFDIVE